MARGKPHDPQVKAAVMAALVAGQLPAEVARDFKLDQSVVSRWAKQIPEKMQEVASQKTRDFGEMLGNYLEELLTTATEQQLHFRDKDWLKRQPASDLAVLHGVCIDKGIRLFEAAARASETHDA